jgi:hypothetical protein
MGGEEGADGMIFLRKGGTIIMLPKCCRSASRRGKDGWGDPLATHYYRSGLSSDDGEMLAQSDRAAPSITTTRSRESGHL